MLSMANSFIRTPFSNRLLGDLALSTTPNLSEAALEVVLAFVFWQHVSLYCKTLRCLPYFQ
jgi:hypothetical protein